MFGKKKKQETPQVPLEERLEQMEKKLTMRLLTLQKQKKETLAEILNARRYGLSAHEERARALLRMKFASEQQINGMLVSMRLTVQERDFASLTQDFVECIEEVSRDLTQSVVKTNVKKAEKEYMRAMYSSLQQAEKLDRMLEVGDLAYLKDADNGKYTEFDSKIDELIGLAEANEGKVPRDTI
mgnify:CR=1 FL=1